MSQTQFAHINHRGVEFAIVVVKDEYVNLRHKAVDAIARYQKRFGCPVVLRGSSNFRNYGRNDLVTLLQTVSDDRIPWMQGNLGI